MKSRKVLHKIECITRRRTPAADGAALRAPGVGLRLNLAAVQMEFSGLDSELSSRLSLFYSCSLADGLLKSSRDLKKFLRSKNIHFVDLETSGYAHVRSYWRKWWIWWKTRKAVTLVMLQSPAPARELTTWIHVPSQPLMQSLLSQFQTPTVPRKISWFLRVWLPTRSPCRTDHPAYFGPALFI